MNRKLLTETYRNLVAHPDRVREGLGIKHRWSLSTSVSSQLGLLASGEGVAGGLDAWICFTYGCDGEAEPLPDGADLTEQAITLAELTGDEVEFLFDCSHKNSPSVCTRLEIILLGRGATPENVAEIFAINETRVAPGATLRS